MQQLPQNPSRGNDLSQNKQMRAKSKFNYTVPINRMFVQL